MFTKSADRVILACMARDKEGIRVSMRSAIGRWQVSYIEDPGWILLPKSVNVDWPRERVKEYARKHKWDYLRSTGKTLKHYAENFFDPDGAWVKRQREKGREFNPRTLRNREGYLRNYIIPLFGDRDPGSLKRREIDDAVLKAERVSGTGKPLAPGTRDDIIETFMIFLDDLQDLQIIDANPLAGIVRYSNKPVNPRDALPRESIPKLFPDNHGDLIKIWGSPMWVSIMLAFSDTGLRPMEMGRMRWRDFVVEKNEDEKRNLYAFVFRGAKGGKMRAVGLSTRTAQELLIWKAQSWNAEEDDYIFTMKGTAPITDAGILEAFRRGASRVVGEVGRTWTTYQLRHTFVTHSLSYLKEEEISLLAGHSVQVDRIYQHPDIKAALDRSREARKKLHDVRG